MKIILRISVGLLLVLIALFIFLSLLVPSIIVKVAGALITRSSVSLYQYFKDIAISIDQLGNVVCSELFFILLITCYSRNMFGNPDETISSVLGKNQRDNTLTLLGKLIVWVLDIVDENHSEKAIEDDEQN